MRYLPLLLVACSHGKADKRVTCDEYVDKADALSGFKTQKPLGAAEIQYCESHTQEQLRCAIAATDLDHFSLCEIADTSQRAIATRVLPEIRKSWPGTASARDIAFGKEGCAFAMIASGAIPPTENEVRGAFALRPTGHTGDPQQIIVRMRRTGTDWVCVDEGDAVSCEALAIACRHAP